MPRGRNVAIPWHDPRPHTNFLRQRQDKAAVDTLNSCLFDGLGQSFPRTGLLARFKAVEAFL